MKLIIKLKKCVKNFNNLILNSQVLKIPVVVQKYITIKVYKNQEINVNITLLLMLYLIEQTLVILTMERFKNM